jgi:membrane fusion protein, multidrug efflux system
MLHSRFLVVALVVTLVACGRGPADVPDDRPAKQAKADAKPTLPLLIAPEDLVTVRAGDRAHGPLITGSIQPERRADLRAEVSAVVMQVAKENGETVRTGDLLVRLDDTAIRENLGSAQESARAARQALEQAQRQVERLKTLQAQGMSPMQVLEDAEVRRNNAQSEVAAAESRVVTARQQLRRTEVRAPFDGVVSERKVSVGDTVQAGRELIKVVDPRSMRFEGLVSADRMHELKIGQSVSFRVNGYPQDEFAGIVKRVDAAANATTRQVEVLVGFAGADAPRVAGLYAEGRIASAVERVLSIPENSVVRAGEATHVWRVQDNSLRRIAVKLGERDERRGDYPVRAGLTEGDRILRNPGSTLVEGQPVELTATPAVAGVGTGAVKAAAPAAAALKNGK